MYQVAYQRGGIIQQRSRLRSAWDVTLPELNQLMVGRVESYWRRPDGVVRWRSLDHWLCDWEEDLPNREEATRGLLTRCPRAAALIKQRRERTDIAQGPAVG